VDDDDSAAGSMGFMTAMMAPSPASGHGAHAQRLSLVTHAAKRLVRDAGATVSDLLLRETAVSRNLSLPGVAAARSRRQSANVRTSRRAAEPIDAARPPASPFRVGPSLTLLLH
jgi:hypothetical protein